MLFAMLVLAYGGWNRWPWWSPIAAMCVLLPVTIAKAVITDSGRAQVGIEGISWADFGLAMLVNLAALFAIFLIAREIGVLARRPSP